MALDPFRRIAVACASLCVVIVLIAIGRGPSALCGPDYSRSEIPVDYIVDCRGFYFQESGLWSKGRIATTDPFLGRVMRPPPDWPPVAVMAAVGRAGFMAGNVTHIVDVLGLTDPLLSRIPALEPAAWKIAHVRRHLPTGYLASIRTGVNQIEDDSLAAYWDDLRLVTQGPLFSMARVRAIGRLYFGGDTALLQEYLKGSYLAEVQQDYSLNSFKARPGEGSLWWEEGVLVLERRVRIPLLDLEPVPHSLRFQVACGADDQYSFLLLDGERPVESRLVEPATPDANCPLRSVQVKFDFDAGALAAPGLAVFFSQGDGIGSLGRIEIED